jgi:hypothetical protein
MRNKRKSLYIVVEIYDIAMAQAELAGSHVALKVGVPRAFL